MKNVVSKQASNHTCIIILVNIVICGLGIRGFYEGILSFWPLFITNIPILYSRFMMNVSPRIGRDRCYYMSVLPLFGTQLNSCAKAEMPSPRTSLKLDFVIREKKV